MPTLHWVGKDKVRHHHRDVPYRVLRDHYRFAAPVDAPTNSTDNRIIQGDNLEALKALLPEFGGKVQCIYIDPPYNTGNEGWVYNDNVSDPRMRKWLGQVVGKEGEDMSRHDKWLCMMYPRLKLLRRLLAKDGAIFVSIDDNEVAKLRLVMDEVFGAHNFVASAIWNMMDSPKNTAQHFSEDHEYVLIYAANKDVWRPNALPRSDAMVARYRNPDNDPRGPWLLSDLAARNFYAEGRYPITTPSGRVIEGPPSGSYWRVSEEKFWELDRDNRIWWGLQGNNRPGIKRFLAEVKDGVVPRTLWPWPEVGSTRHSKQEISKILSLGASSDLFITPKPSSLIERILRLATDKNSIILDSYAGSGTTAHAVLKLNAQDGGNRRFILIEMMDYAENLTAERVRRVINGYGQGSKAVAGLGGGFIWQSLGEPLFDDCGQLNPAVRLEAIRDYVAWQEGIPKAARLPLDNPQHRYCLGEANGLRVFFAYEAERATTLDLDLLAELVHSPGPTLIYADQLALGEAFMRRHAIRFKKIPRDIARL
ncbi:site-specific DNA-methyltransferase [Stutzerimonas frequens]|uniref:site-specific DNA-methyltransferase n=1 Tax=Stutzerimonas frequens TaxID=2968969 RepID=UPI003749E1D5